MLTACLDLNIGDYQYLCVVNLSRRQTLIKIFTKYLPGANINNFAIFFPKSRESSSQCRKVSQEVNAVQVISLHRSVDGFELGENISSCFLHLSPSSHDFLSLCSPGHWPLIGWEWSHNAVLLGCCSCCSTAFNFPIMQRSRGLQRNRSLDIIWGQTRVLNC